MLPGQVQQHGVGEVEAVRVRERKGRCQGERVEVEQNDRAGGELEELLPSR